MKPSNQNDLLLRLQELDELLRSRHTTDAANRLCDFVTEFSDQLAWKNTCMSYCMRADQLNDLRNRVIGSLQTNKKLAPA